LTRTSRMFIFAIVVSSKDTEKTGRSQDPDQGPDHNQVVDYTNLCRVKDLVVSIYRLEKRLRTRYGLTLNEILCLCSVSRLEQSPGELAGELQISGSRISRILGSLEKKGLVQRRFSDRDRRSVLLRITRDGEKRISRIRTEGSAFPSLMG